MNDEKNKRNPLKIGLVILFILFISFYIALESGYYPNRVERKTVLTNNEIKLFEEDVKNGKSINNNGYIEKDVNYSNFVTKVGNGLTNTLGKMIEKGSKGIKTTIKVLFW